MLCRIVGRQLVGRVRRNQGALRGAVERQLELRHTPELRFLFDDSLERGARIFDLLNQVKEQEKEKEKGIEE